VEACVESGGAVVSWINLGEVFYIEARSAGETAAAGAVDAIRRRVRTEEVDSELVLDAARIKSSETLSYADAFAVALAERLGLTLLTGDPEIRALDRAVDVIDLSTGQ
jgi:ribonuclease VapC